MHNITSLPIFQKVVIPMSTMHIEKHNNNDSSVFIFKGEKIYNKIKFKQITVYIPIVMYVNVSS